MINYIIISKPDYIKCVCPFCEEDIEINFDEINFYTDYWNEGGYVDCPECDNTFELGEYDYD